MSEQVGGVASEQTGTQVSDGEQNGSKRGFWIAGVAGAAALVGTGAFFGVKEAAETPQDSYSSMSGAQVEKPSNPIKWLARVITGAPGEYTRSGNVADTIEQVFKTRQHGLSDDEEARDKTIQDAVEYAVAKNPTLEPYVDQRIPGGKTVQIPLLSPDVQFVGPSNVALFYRERNGNYTDSISGVDGEVDVNIQDAVYEENKAYLSDNGGEWPKTGMYLASLSSLTGWIGEMPNMSESQKEVTIRQAVELMTPPTVPEDEEIESQLSDSQLPITPTEDPAEDGFLDK